MVLLKKTKIICTIGPACSDEKILHEMIEAGMDVARLNFSHGTHKDHAKVIAMLRNVRKKDDVPLPIMLDTKGPEYRIGTFKDGPVCLKDGDSFTFTAEDVEGDSGRVSVSYKDLPKELSKGDVILVNDGLVKFEVVSTTDSELVCRTLIGGKLSDRKSMSFPGKVFTHEYLSDQDKADLLFGIENDVDFVACSFVSRAEDVMAVRRFLDVNGGKSIQIIAKIENQSGVDNASSILDCCEGLMVARGDLGVEIPYEKLPAVQKQLLKLCRKKGGISITATEMLESMTENPRPTRAEISDVANAVFDGTSVIMLSGETAAGKYPVEAVKAMTAIALDAEKNTNYLERFVNGDFRLSGATDALSHAACQLAIDSNAACIVACTRSGATGRMISRFRAPMPILGVTSSRKAYRHMGLSWGVYPMVIRDYDSTDELFENAVESAKESGFAEKGEYVVVTCGASFKKGDTSLIHINQIK